MRMDSRSEHEVRCVANGTFGSIRSSLEAKWEVGFRHHDTSNSNAMNAGSKVKASCNVALALFELYKSNGSRAFAEHNDIVFNDVLTGVFKLLLTATFQ